MAKRITKKNVVVGGKFWECSRNYHTVTSATENCEEYELIKPLRSEVFTYLEEKDGTRFIPVESDDEDDDSNAYWYLAYQFWNVRKLSDPNHIFRKSIHYLVGQNFSKVYVPSEDMSITIEYSTRNKDIDPTYKEDNFVNEIF